VSTWNKFHETIAGHKRTNNVSEGFNSVFSANVEPFPSLWKVMVEFQKRERLAQDKAKDEIAKVRTTTLFISPPYSIPVHIY